MKRSRINQRMQKQAKRNMLLLIAGIIVVMVVGLFFGIKLLVNFSLFVEKKTDASTQQQESSFIASPILDPILTATNSGSLDVSGSASTGKYAVIYINGKQNGKADIKEDGSFAFKDLSLNTDTNDIKVKVVDEDKNESKFSPTAHITYSIKSPDLSIDYPSDGQTYHKNDNPLKVRGKTEPDVRVTVNGFWAVTDHDGNYSYGLLLHGGDNELKIVATDPAGNKSEKSLKVIYSE